MQQSSGSSSQSIKWQLQIIFIYYTSYADRNNYKLLKQQNYRRFLIDSETVKTQSSLVHYDIAFQKINHSAIIYKDFLKLIPDIAEIVYKGIGRSKAFNRYIHEHIQPLFAQIIQKSELGQDINTALTSKIDKQVHKKLLKLPITQKSYSEYISTSTSNNKDTLQVFECFANFLKDFQICPHLVSKSLVYIIFLSLVKDKNVGDTCVFTCDDFVKALIVVSEVCARKLAVGELSGSAKMIKMLERMEISAGFDRVSKKIMYETAISPSFLKSFMDGKFEEDGYLDKLDKNVSRMYPGASRHRNCSQSMDITPKKQQRKQELKQQNLEAVENILSQQNQAFSQQFRQIKLAFEELCEMGEVANSKTLKSIKIKKLFERIGLISLIGQAWLDIQVVNLQRSSQTGKIQFPQFLELLSLTARKIGSNFEQIVKLVLTDQQLTHKLSQQSTLKRISRYSQQDEQLLKQIMQACQKQAQKIYRKYTSDNPLMSFTQLSKMMYDFEIFPTIISKNKLYQIFSTINDVRQENQPNGSHGNHGLQKLKKGGKDVQNYLKDDKKIDFSGFLMGLIEVAQEICDQSLEVGQKIIILLEKINQSAGYKKISNVSLVHNLRKKFAGYYVRNFQKQKQQPQDFDQLLHNFT